MKRGPSMYESLKLGKPVDVEELETLADCLGGSIGINKRIKPHTVNVCKIASKLSFDFIFDFKINFETVEERIISRSEKEKRSDDNIDAIKTRLKKYTEDTFPVSELFKSNFMKKYFTIDASQEISKIQKELLKIIKKA